MKVSIRNIDQLPTTSGLYLVLSRNSEVVYVGQAANIHERWHNGHHKTCEIVSLYGTDVEICCVEIPQHRLNHAEYLAVKFYKPHLNQVTPSIV